MCIHQKDQSYCFIGCSGDGGIFKRFPDQSTYSDEVFNEVYANINAYVWRLSVEDVESVI